VASASDPGGVLGEVFTHALISSRMLNVVMVVEVVLLDLLVDRLVPADLIALLVGSLRCLTFASRL